MAPKDVYQDDGALTKFLDGLIDSGNEGGTPNVSAAADISRTNVDVTFSSQSLHEGISAANDLLREGGQCPLLPTLTETRDNVADVLAAAVTAIVRLSRCCKANVNLRTEAERVTRASQANADQLSRLLHASKEKAEKKDSALAVMRNTLAETESKNKSTVRQLTTECNRLKARLANAAHRENHLKLEATQRERQFSQLQKRVHNLMANTKKLSIEPVITAAAATLSVPRDKLAAYAEDHGSDTADCEGSNSDDMESGLVERVFDENLLLRDTVLSVHRELDELLVQFPDASGFFSSEKVDGDSEFAVTQKSGIPPPAPSVERMMLPYEMIREEFESNLEHKFRAVRAALSGVE